MADLMIDLESQAQMDALIEHLKMYVDVSQPLTRVIGSDIKRFNLLIWLCYTV
jgi:hypothetical protein